MKKKEAPAHFLSVGIVGAGPRGLSALESLYHALADNNVDLEIRTLLFEEKELPGAGHVYDLNQPDTNWLNVSERGLTIPARKEIRHGAARIPAFPSYHEWAGYNEAEDAGEVPDKFPLRSKLGRYLNDRYISIAATLEEVGVLMVIRGPVVAADYAEDHFTILLEDGSSYQVDEMVLTIGHQPTKNSKQISNWLDYAKDNPTIDLITQPYPIARTLESPVFNANNIVALRGFGLAMIDVMRGLTAGLSGRFDVVNEATREMRYVRGGNEPSKIIPFSLDGLPMAPKPLNLEIDQWFFPTEEEKKSFGNYLSQVSKQGDAEDISFMVDAVTPIVIRVLKQLRSKARPNALKPLELKKVIHSWLADPDYEHELIVSKKDPTKKMLEAFVGMATGSKLVSLDFCIGHVWRHCQPTLYEALSFSNLPETIIAAVVQLDERLKRYSYGPPVDSLQQLLALVRGGIVSLDFVDDPEIETTNDGWKLTKDNDTVVAQIMVNSVLDSPKLLEVNSLLVLNLLHESMIAPIHGDLGIETHENGCVILAEEKEELPLAILGRLAKGTLIGVDAILECFGQRSNLWAEGLVDRLNAS